MTEDRNESTSLNDGTEGSNVGFMRYEGAEEKSSLNKGEPEKESDFDKENEEDKGREEEPEEEEEESGVKEEEEEVDESILPKVSKELQEERKALLKAFTKKSQGIAEIRLQAKLVEAIDRNPEAVIKDLARRYGVNLSESKEVSKKEKIDFEPEKIVPKEGEELPSFIQRAIAENLKNIPNLINNAVKDVIGTQKTQPQKVTAGDSDELDEVAINSVLTYLDETYSDWGLYEEKMIDIVTKHPSYMNDIDGLYEVAKAQSVDIRDRVKASKEKKKRKVERSGQRGSAVKITTSKGKKYTFDEAWDRAKREIK